MPKPITASAPAISHQSPLGAAWITRMNPNAPSANDAKPTTRVSNLSNSQPHGGFVNIDIKENAATAAAASTDVKPCSRRNRTPLSRIAKMPTTEMPKISTIR